MRSEKQPVKILAVIENDMYVRNFVTSGALNCLIQRDDFGIAVSEVVVKLRDEIPSDKLVGAYTRSAANIRLTYIFNKLSMRALRKKSATFRIKVSTGWQFGQYSWF